MKRLFGRKAQASSAVPLLPQTSSDVYDDPDAPAIPGSDPTSGSTPGGIDEGVARLGSSRAVRPGSSSSSYASSTFQTQQQRASLNAQLHTHTAKGGNYTVSTPANSYGVHLAGGGDTASTTTNTDAGSIIARSSSAAMGKAGVVSAAPTPAVAAQVPKSTFFHMEFLQQRDSIEHPHPASVQVSPFALLPSALNGKPLASSKRVGGAHVHSQSSAVDARAYQPPPPSAASRLPSSLTMQNPQSPVQAQAQLPPLIAPSAHQHATHIHSSLASLPRLHGETSMLPPQSATAAEAAAAPPSEPFQPLTPKQYDSLGKMSPLEALHPAFALETIAHSQLHTARRCSASDGPAQADPPRHQQQHAGEGAGACLQFAKHQHTHPQSQASLEAYAQQHAPLRAVQRPSSRKQPQYQCQHSNIAPSASPPTNLTAHHFALWSAGSGPEGAELAHAQGRAADESLEIIDLLCTPTSADAATCSAFGAVLYDGPVQRSSVDSSQEWDRGPQQQQQRVQHISYSRPGSRGGASLAGSAQLRHASPSADASGVQQSHNACNRRGFGLGLGPSQDQQTQGQGQVWEQPQHGAYPSAGEYAINPILPAGGRRGEGGAAAGGECSSPMFVQQLIFSGSGLTQNPSSRAGTPPSRALPSSTPIGGNVGDARAASVAKQTYASPQEQQASRPVAKRQSSIRQDGEAKENDPSTLLMQQKSSRKWLGGAKKDKEKEKDEEEAKAKDKSFEKEGGKGKDKDKAEENRVGPEEKGIVEVTAKIGWLCANEGKPFEWAYMLSLARALSRSESASKEAARALRKEFKYAMPDAQKRAARVWAILALNASDYFRLQIATKRFLEVVDDIIKSSKTPPPVKGGVLNALSVLAYEFHTDKELSSITKLYNKHRPPDKPINGEGLNIQSKEFKPPPDASLRIVRRQARPQQPVIAQQQIIPREVDIRKLHEECSIAVHNSQLLVDALTADPSQPELITEFSDKLRLSQEFLLAQIPWASAEAEKARDDAAQAHVQHVHEDADPSAGERVLTDEEELLGDLLDANEHMNKAMMLLRTKHRDLALADHAVRFTFHEVNSRSAPQFFQSHNEQLRQVGVLSSPQAQLQLQQQEQEQEQEEALSDQHVDSALFEALVHDDRYRDATSQPSLTGHDRAGSQNFSLPSGFLDFTSSAQAPATVPALTPAEGLAPTQSVGDSVQPVYSSGSLSTSHGLLPLQTMPTPQQPFPADHQPSANVVAARASPWATDTFVPGQQSHDYGQIRSTCNEQGYADVSIGALSVAPPAVPVYRGGPRPFPGSTPSANPAPLTSSTLQSQAASQSLAAPYELQAVPSQELYREQPHMNPIMQTVLPSGNTGMELGHSPASRPPPLPPISTDVPAGAPSVASPTASDESSIIETPLYPSEKALGKRRAISICADSNDSRSGTQEKPQPHTHPRPPQPYPYNGGSAGSAGGAPPEPFRDNAYMDFLRSRPMPPIIAGATQT